MAKFHLAVFVAAMILSPGCDETPAPEPYADSGGVADVSVSDDDLGTIPADLGYEQGADAGPGEDATSVQGPDLGPVGPGRFELIEGDVPRGSGQTLTVLAEDVAQADKVLIVGGQVNVADDVTHRPKTIAQREAWLYDLETNEFSPAGQLRTGRHQHTATLLGDGRVMIIGGRDTNGDRLASTEIFDPSKPTTEAWSSGPPIIGGARSAHAAVRLQDGKVFLLGGSGSGTADTVAVYDPVANSWQIPAGLMNAKRSEYPAAAVLESGKVVVIGGGVETVEVYDPIEGVFVGIGSPEDPQVLSAPKENATLIPYRDRADKEKVLVVGGSPDVSDTTIKDEIFDPSFDSIREISHPEGSPQGQAAVRLPDGRVLVSGGQHVNQRSLVMAFAPTAVPPAWTLLPSLNVGRYGHRAATLKDGSVLVVGGLTASDEAYVDTAERFIPNGSQSDPSRPTLTWSEVPVETGDDLNAVWGTAPDNVYAGGQDGRLYHFDGTDWQAVPLPVEYWTIADIHGSGPDNIVVLNVWGGVFQFDGADWTKICDLDEQSDNADHYHGVWAFDASNIVIVGDNGVIRRTSGETDGEGKPLWVAQTSNSPDEYADLLDIYAATPNDIYVAGEYGVVLHFNGSTWAPLVPLVGLNLNGITGDGAGAVYVAGDAGGILRYLQGRWTVMGSRSGSYFNGIVAGDAGNVYAAGANGSLRHFGGSGVTWSAIASGSTATANSVWAAGQTVFLVGDDGLVLRGRPSAAE